MNSLNILSARVSPPNTPSTQPRANPLGNPLGLATDDARRSSRDDTFELESGAEKKRAEESFSGDHPDSAVDEKSALLSRPEDETDDPRLTGWHTIPRRISTGVIDSFRWVLSTIAAPGIYLIACLYDEHGNFAPFYFLRRGTAPGQAGKRLGRHGLDGSSHEEDTGASKDGKSRSSSKRGGSIKSKRSPSISSSSSGMSSESEFERSEGRRKEMDADSPARHTRSKTLQSADVIDPARRSIRIKLQSSEETLRNRKHRKASSTSTNSTGNGTPGSDISPATLKSPTSPSNSLLMTKYPRTTAPPRPLIPLRQPSYSRPEGSNGRLAQKTLILDLDETLIHSMAKGGRMSTGHMVEVKLNTYLGSSGERTAGPQHPILYYVHKRPHCDDFLRRVCKWYNLVIFTASVQEYADPVIDWLEQERKFFSGRYYRQHCTYRAGAFIKDLTCVEPDLSKVMILDNSPQSYAFHEDNAIPIEGWINDPTDNDLLHLVPLLEGLQYVTDVRALLALRGGEDGKHVTQA